MLRANHDIISSLDDLSGWEPNSILLHDLLDHSLGYLVCMRREQPNASWVTRGVSKHLFWWEGLRICDRPRQTKEGEGQMRDWNGVSKTRNGGKQLSHVAAPSCDPRILSLRVDTLLSSCFSRQSGPRVLGPAPTQSCSRPFSRLIFWRFPVQPEPCRSPS